jgi:hypothetical protein
MAVAGEQLDAVGGHSVCGLEITFDCSHGEDWKQTDLEIWQKKLQFSTTDRACPAPSPRERKTDQPQQATHCKPQASHSNRRAPRVKPRDTN